MARDARRKGLRVRGRTIRTPDIRILLGNRNDERKEFLKKFKRETKRESERERRASEWETSTWWDRRDFTDLIGAADNAVVRTCGRRRVHWRHDGLRRNDDAAGRRCLPTRWAAPYACAFRTYDAVRYFYYCNNIFSRFLLDSRRDEEPYRFYHKTRSCFFVFLLSFAACKRFVHQKSSRIRTRYSDPFGIRVGLVL